VLSHGVNNANPSFCAERGQPLEATGWETKRRSYLLPGTKRGISIIDPMRKH